MTKRHLIRIDGDFETREVYVNGIRLDPRPSQKVWNHSPDGFNWGYGGSGPAQLALAILLRYTDEDTARKNHQRFKWDCIATLPQSDIKVEVDIHPYLDR